MAAKSKAASARSVRPVVLPERGIRTEAEAKQSIKATHRRFLEEHEPDRKNEAGHDLIRAIFGKDSIAEDSVL